MATPPSSAWPCLDERARVYRIERPSGPIWVAWRDPKGVLLPDDGTPELDISLTIPGTTAEVEPVITVVGQDEPKRASLPVSAGAINVTLTHTPVFITSK